MKCCVYLQKDINGEILYIGISKDVWRRSVEHQKAKWFDRVVTIEVKHFDSVEEAREHEEFLVKKLKPRFNVEYLLHHGLNYAEKRKAVVGEDHNFLRPMVLKLISEFGEYSAARKIGMARNTLLSFVASQASVPFECTIRKVKKYFEESA